MNNLAYYYAVKTVFIIIVVVLMILAVFLSCFIYYVIEQIMKIFKRKFNNDRRLDD